MRFQFPHRLNKTSSNKEIADNIRHLFDVLMHGLDQSNFGSSVFDSLGSTSNRPILHTHYLQAWTASYQPSGNHVIGDYTAYDNGASGYDKCQMHAVSYFIKTGTVSANTTEAGTPATYSSETVTGEAHKLVHETDPTVTPPPAGVSSNGLEASRVKITVSAGAGSTPITVVQWVMQPIDQMLP